MMKSESAGRILVINPNSSDAVTGVMDEALAPLRSLDGPGVECMTMADGPPGIETQAHIDGVVAPICQLVAGEANYTDAFVIACFSDPGLQPARQVTSVPVFGIAESAFAMALNYGERFGVIAILAESAVRQRKYVCELGLNRRYAGSKAVGLGVSELEGASTADRLETVGRGLVDDAGADVLILGCTGMARYRRSLEQTLGISVIDPTQAAVVQATAAVRLNGWSA